MGLSIAQALPAQHHNNAWFRSTLGIPLDDKFSADVEFQHRRQSGIESKNMLDNNLMFTFRNWVHYQHTPNLKFSVSPFAYFSNYRIIQEQGDQVAKPNSEIRFSIAQEFQHRTFGRIFLVNRNALEYRITKNLPNNITRFRTRLGGRYELAEHLRLTVFDEFFMNAAGTSSAHFSDHNRTGMNVEYNVLPNLKFEFGYIYLIRFSIPSPSGDMNLYENNVLINLSCHIKNHKRNNK